MADGGMRNGPKIEEDRYTVILACGHWTQTRRPDDATWWCEEHGEQPASLYIGEPAVLGDLDQARYRP